MAPHQLLGARRIAEHGRTGGYVAGHDAAGADDRVVGNADTGQDDGARADPYVATDPDRPARLQTTGTLVRVAGMVCSQYLHARTDLGQVTDDDFDDIENDAVEVQEYSCAEADVEAVVTMERRADDGAFADLAQAFLQQAVPCGGGVREAGVVPCQPGACCRLVRLDLGRVGVV